MNRQSWDISLDLELITSEFFNSLDKLFALFASIDLQYDRGKILLVFDGTYLRKKIR